MDNVRERIEALERQTEQLKHETQALKTHTRIVERRLCWWRGIACSVMLLGLVSLPLQSGTAADTQPGAMGDRMAAVENKLSAMTFDATANEVIITGANLRIVNGLGSTATTNGLGNLIVGYNESREADPDCENVTRSRRPCIDTRTGSHNVVVGQQNNFSSFGGLVAGELNEISAGFAWVSGGQLNLAEGILSSVSGGFTNTASAFASSVSGGERNMAEAAFSSLSGGFNNTAAGVYSAVSGGASNMATGDYSTVSGGRLSTAAGRVSSVSGGPNVVQTAEDGWAAGSFGGKVSGSFSSP
jgi:hypothetical protein